MKLVASTLLMTLALCSGLRAQNITGTITGTVEDQSGARVPNVPVIATNTGTGVTYRAAATESGVYVLPLLPLGKYVVSVETQGFKRFVREGLQLGADERLRVDVRLELGSVAEEVKVTASAPLIQTDRSTVGGSFTPQQFENLPIGRDATSTMKLLPGVQASKYGLSAGNINGSREAMTDFKVDGAAAVTANLGQPRIQPILELIEELVVQTSNYSAEFGRGAGQVSVTTRSGTNEVHGALFHYFQNNLLNANSFFNNFYGNTKPVLRYNLFGGTMGGPVYLPKLYDGRNRTFFSFAYEGTRRKGYGQMVSSVPTPAMRGGDFSGQVAIYDPATTAPNPAGSGFIRTPFANNRIPATRFDPVSMAMLENSYPLPTRPGVANNYVRFGPTSSTANGVNARIDHNFNEKSRITGRYVYRASENLNLMRFPGPAGAGSNSDSLSGQIIQHLASVDHTYVIHPNLIQNLHFGYFNDYAPKGGPGTNEGWPEKLGLKNVAPDTFPLVNINSFSPFGGSNLADQRPANNFDITDSVTLVKGRHSLKLGFEYRKLRSFFWQPQTSSGNFTFNTLPTMDPRTQREGYGFASFLLGMPSNTAFNLYPTDGFETRWSYFAGYLQDDIRVSRKLTLNLGARWEMTTPRREAKNRQSNFDLKTLNLQYSGLNGYPDTIYDTKWTDFAPRVGLAYTPFGDTRTVIRAGYGIFWLPGNYVGDGSFTTGPWRRNYTWVSPDNGITFPFAMREGVPKTSFSEPFVLGPLSAVQWMSRDNPDGYMQQWSFNIERQVFTNAMFEVGYLGTKGTHIQVNREYNQVPANLLGPGNAQQRRPYPTRGNITNPYAPTGNSTYHALQLRFERRFSGGFSLLSTYTFSKTIDDCSGTMAFRAFGVTGAQDQHNLRLEKSVSGYDETHNFAYALTWQVPVGRGRKVLSASRWLDPFLGGWNASVMSSAITGKPLIMGTLSNLTGSLGGGSRPIRLRTGALSGENRGLTQWFDPSAFTLPAPFTFGNTSRTEPWLREPGDFSFDVMLAKEFRIAEQKRVQFRSEFFNATNHFNPGTPNTTIGGPAVGTITGGSGGRSIQLSLKLYY